MLASIRASLMTTPPHLCAQRTFCGQGCLPWCCQESAHCRSRLAPTRSGSLDGAGASPAMLGRRARNAMTADEVKVVVNTGAELAPMAAVGKAGFSISLARGCVQRCDSRRPRDLHGARALRAHDRGRTRRKPPRSRRLAGGTRGRGRERGSRARAAIVVTRARGRRSRYRGLNDQSCSRRWSAFARPTESAAARQALSPRSDDADSCRSLPTMRDGHARETSTSRPCSGQASERVARTGGPWYLPHRQAAVVARRAGPPRDSPSESSISQLRPSSRWIRCPTTRSTA